MQEQEKFIEVNWTKVIIYFVLPVLFTVILFLGMVFGVYVPTIRDSMINTKKEMLRELVTIAYEIVDYQYALSQEGLLSEGDAQQKALGLIKNLKFGEDGSQYFWIHNTQNKMVMHPYHPSMEGKELSYLKDEEGNPFVLAMTKLALEQSQGFISYPWRHTEEDKTATPKISYIRLFEPWGWIIGSGVYYPAVDADIQKVIDKTNKALAFALVCLILISSFMALQSIRAEDEREAAVEILEENEKNYRELVQTAKSIILKMDVEGNVTFVNEFAQSFFGYAAEDILGKNVIGTIVPLTESTTGRNLKELILSIGSNPEDYHNNVNENCTKEGKRVWVSWTNQPIFDENNSLVGVLCVGNDITEQKRIGDQLQLQTKSLELANDKLRYLYQHVYDIRDDERRIIAREIHDELGQLMTAIRMDISMLQKEVSEGKSEAVNKFQDVFALIDTTVDSIRKISGSLHPAILDDLGLVSAIEWLLETFQKRSGIFCERDLPSEEIPKGPHDIVLFRALQESLTNVSRHAKATHVSVRLRSYDQKTFLSIKDNGVGLSASLKENKNSLGLVGMRERIQIMGGTVEIKSAPQEGTEISLMIPIRS